MRRLVLPLLLGGAVLLSPIASRSSAPEPTLREGLVLPLPGQLNTELMVNDNNPEVVSDSGILLSTFAGQGKAHPDAHLDVPLSGSFELFSHHVFAGKGQAPNSTLWLAVVVGNRSNQPVTVSIPSAATHLSQPDAPFLPLPPRMVHDGTSVYSGPGGRAAGDLLSRAPRSESLPERIELSPGQIDVLTSLPIPVAGLDPLLNGRNLQARFNSTGPISLATLALISDRRPSEKQWLDLLQNGKLSSKEHEPSPKGAAGPMIYSRVSGVQQGTRWRGVLTSPGRTNLEVTTQPISWPIASLQRGTLGTGQVQSAQLTDFYPGTAWEAHGNYGVAYDLSLPLRNPSSRPQTLDLRLESPLKSNRRAAGLRFIEPAQGPIFWRGNVAVKGTDAGRGRRTVHLVLRKGDPGQSLGRVSLAPGEQKTVQVQLIVPADITPVQVLTVAPVKQSDS
ncbi:uncharacterized conserved secreted protein (DUF3370) [Synechococcus sp. Minos11]|uniref:DUF3370 domain-containing protein n=1 Tax=Synechococcus sp. Minos11 TaxID=221341 RepID=UPI00015253F0|nr:DUF3370 domain-containing protein [Synechococcus sp. Minos11]QNJ08273.1 uncharacterized conserved secreted protein (DUF3370) [Synechococcus sp. Minos11]RCL61840.1 MAG: DUF3370 domain-containing protein [Synechococcus sp. MED-G67]CAK27633.1 Uncharacterized conserved secreted protein [Synechococcus sp. RCC307]